MTKGVSGCMRVRGGYGAAGVVVINATFVVVVERGCMAFQRGHVTSLVRVGGVACEGDGCGC